MRRVLPTRGDTKAKGQAVPHLLFYENGVAPTTRSVRELTSLHAHGWDITVAHAPSEGAAVRALGFASCLVPEPMLNPFRARLKSQLAAYVADNDALQARIDVLLDAIGRQRRDAGLDALLERQAQIVPRARELAEKIRAARDSAEVTARARHLESLRVLVGELADRTTARRLAGDAAGSAKARQELEEAKAQRQAVAEAIRGHLAAERAELEAINAERTEITAALAAVAATEQAELAELKAQRIVTSARIRATRAARKFETPLTTGGTFGDLTRLEMQWHDAAQAMVSVSADVLWAADLDALPPIAWVADATGDPPIIFDSHEIFTDLEYLPPALRHAWRMIADRFIPMTTLAITVSDTIAGFLRDRHGAPRTAVVPNFAAASVHRSTSPTTLRETLGLDADVPLAVHVGTISQNRNPGVAVDLLAAAEDIHVAFVGTAISSVVTEMINDAETRGVGKRLHVVPPVPLSELTAFIADADVALMMYDGVDAPNVTLAMPNKLYDGLAAGLPVLSVTGTAAAEFLVEAALGAEFDLADPASLVAAIRTLINDGPLRDRVRASADEFAWPAIAPHLCELVDGVLADSGRG